MLNSVRSWLQELVSDGILIERETSDAVTFRLAVAPGAEYGFVVAVAGDEVQLLAERVGAAPGEYFWYHPFEPHGTYRAPGALEAGLRAEVEQVVSHATRIVQRRGLLSWLFRCEYLDASGEWRLVYAHNLLRGSGEVPPIEGSERAYFSPALRRAR